MSITVMFEFILCFEILVYIGNTFSSEIPILWDMKETKIKSILFDDGKL